MVNYFTHCNSDLTKQLYSFLKKLYVRLIRYIKHSILNIQKQFKNKLIFDQFLFLWILQFENKTYKIMSGEPYFATFYHIGYKFIEENVGDFLFFWSLWHKRKTLTSQKK